MIWPEKKETHYNVYTNIYKNVEWNAAIDACREIYDKDPRLVPLNEEKLKECFKEYFHPITHNAFIKELCRRFGQPSVPNIEDIEKTIWDLENSIGFKPAYRSIAIAIHNLLNKNNQG